MSAIESMLGINSKATLSHINRFFLVLHFSFLERSLYGIIIVYQSLPAKLATSKKLCYLSQIQNQAKSKTSKINVFFTEIRYARSMWTKKHENTFRFLHLEIQGEQL